MPYWMFENNDMVGIDPIVKGSDGLVKDKGGL